jgi:hypothetical protein
MRVFMSVHSLANLLPEAEHELQPHRAPGMERFCLSKENIPRRRTLTPWGTEAKEVTPWGGSIMASGKQIGEFSLKFTSITLSPGPAGSLLLQANCEGSATGFGTVLGTGTFVGGKSGTYSWCTQGSLDDGEVVTGAGPGAYESVGKHRWRTQGIVQTSDGRSVVGEGEIDLAARSWTGKMFEKI